MESGGLELGLDRINSWQGVAQQNADENKVMRSEQSVLAS